MTELSIGDLNCCLIPRPSMVEDLPVVPSTTTRVMVGADEEAERR
jgi:hypothetical protein